MMRRRGGWGWGGMCCGSSFFFFFDILDYIVVLLLFAMLSFGYSVYNLMRCLCIRNSASMDISRTNLGLILCQYHYSTPSSIQRSIIDVLLRCLEQSSQNSGLFSAQGCGTLGK